MRKKRSEEILLDAAENKKKFMYILKKKPKKAQLKQVRGIAKEQNKKRSREGGDVGASLCVSKVAWGGNG